MDFRRATRADIPAMFKVWLLVTENRLSDPTRITTFSLVRRAIQTDMR